MINTAVLPIGGKGSRMRIKTSTPKLLLELNKKPLIMYTLQKLKSNNIRNIIFISNKQSEEVNKKVAQMCNDLNIKCSIYLENYLRGNFGGILENINNLSDDFIVIYPDIIWDCNLNNLIKFFKESEADITIMIRKSDHIFDSDSVKLTPMMNVSKIYSKVSKTKVPEYQRNDLFGNTGIYIMKHKCLLEMNKILENKYSEIDLFQILETLHEHNKVQISALISSDFIKDCGTPDRFDSVEKLLKNKNILISNNLRKHKVLFLDRDGTLIKKVDGYLTKPSQVKLNQKILKYYKYYTENDYLPIVVTNQPQISMGLIDLDLLDRVHCRIQELLRKENLKPILRFLFCPHHPHNKFNDENIYLKFNCNCRKPKIGLLNEIERYIAIDKKKSIFFGDSERDELFAKNAKISFHHIDSLDTISIN